MRSVQFVILFALFCSTAAAEQTVEYDWLTQGKVSGRLELVIHDDGERSAHFEFNDRGRGPSLDERYRVGADGLIKFYETHGRAYMGAPVDERFVFEDGSARWKSELMLGCRAVAEHDVGARQSVQLVVGEVNPMHTE